MQYSFYKPPIATGGISEHICGRELYSTLFHLNHEKWGQFPTSSHLNVFAKNQLPLRFQICHECYLRVVSCWRSQNSTSCNWQEINKSATFPGIYPVLPKEHFCQHDLRPWNFSHCCDKGKALRNPRDGKVFSYHLAQWFSILFLTWYTYTNH